MGVERSGEDSQQAALSSRYPCLIPRLLWVKREVVVCGRYMGMGLNAVIMGVNPNAGRAEYKSLVYRCMMIVGTRFWSKMERRIKCLNRLPKIELF